MRTRDRFVTPVRAPSTRSSAEGFRVLLLNYEYPPIGGGAGIATEALAHGLAQRGALVDVVTAGRGTEPLSVESIPGAVGGRVVVHRVRARRAGIHEAGVGCAASYLRAALPVVRRLCRTARYDVVHCFFSLPTGLLLPVAGLRGTPVVVSLRGSDVPGYDSSDLRLQRLHVVLRPLTRAIWRRASRVVALSDALAALARKTDPDVPLAVIRNGVDTALFHPPIAPRPVRLDRVRCLVVSRLVERKGIADLLHALASLERGRFELEIVGEGRDEADLRALTARLGLTGEVRFAGALDRAATAERYRCADVFTLPSWDESFGNAFAEAMASGLPIVGSNVGGIPEFVTHEENGLLVPPRQPAAIAQAIRRLADDPQLRAAMRDRNRIKAESALSWERTTQQYLAIYFALAARRRADAPARARVLESARATR